MKLDHIQNKNHGRTQHSVNASSKYCIVGKKFSTLNLQSLTTETLIYGDRKG
jgi:hypothetical protein